MSRPSTVLFVPCFNEADRILTVMRGVAAVADCLDEIVIVDDGSTDASSQQLAEVAVPATVLRHPHRRGLGEAFRSAYRYALEREHRVFCVLAGNGKDDPADLRAVVGPVQCGEADYVQGSRFHPGGGRSVGLPAHRDVAVRVFTRCASWLCHRRFHDCSNGFRAYTTALLQDRRIDWCAPWLGASYQVEIYLLLSAVRLGYRVVEVPVSKTYPADERPYSKADWRDWWRMVQPLAWRLLGLDRVRGPRVAPGLAPDDLQLRRVGPRTDSG